MKTVLVDSVIEFEQADVKLMARDSQKLDKAEPKLLESWVVPLKRGE